RPPAHFSTLSWFLAVSPSYELVNPPILHARCSAGVRQGPPVANWAPRWERFQSEIVPFRESESDFFFISIFLSMLCGIAAGVIRLFVLAGILEGTPLLVTERGMLVLAVNLLGPVAVLRHYCIVLGSSANVEVKMPMRNSRGYSRMIISQSASFCSVS